MSRSLLSKVSDLWDDIKDQVIKQSIDLGPLIVFFIANGLFGIIAATGFFMAATAGAIGASYILYQKVPAMTLITGIFVMVFGGLTIFLHDDTFIKIKPTLIYGLFAIMLFAGQLLGKRPLKFLLGSAIPGMSDKGWAIQTYRWALFFVGAAIANEIAWRNVSTGTWIGMKLWLFLPASILFAMAQAPFLLKNSDLGKPEAPKEPGPVPPVE